ncbi:hypothetical protein [Hydrogenophaga sp. PAMC20947]|uniref:hypothetical protein n=1 Tax=Hydrogenophaga sp. PAMC20947 TaxID=2565558 RepID=UPI00109E1535|nr:hypothetical protein [Hydrogenophaga sp. PAMC20947]QCB45975.1 hypothetical protein E5678_08065 [Hydrogenophaga sp. PAMC20947]
MIPWRQVARAAHNALLMGGLLLGQFPTAQAHEGSHGNEIMWKACDAQKTNDPCSFENLNHDVYRGTCQSISKAMVCVRNQPIDYAVGAPHTPEYIFDPGTPAVARDAGHPGNRWPWMLGYAILIVGALTRFRKLRASKA